MEKRIIIASIRFGDGGASTNRLLGYAKAFADLGYKVHLIFLIKGKNGTKCPLQYRNIHIEHLWERDGFLAKKSKIISYIVNLIRLRRKIKRGDILFTYNAQWPNAVIFNSYRRKCQIYYETNEHPGIYKNKFIEKLRLYYARKANGIFVISNSLREYYLSNGISDSKILIVNMFVDNTRFQGLIKKEEETKYIAYCGTVSKHKDGVDDLIKSFAIFHKQHLDYKLYIIGKSESNEEFLSLKHLASDLSLSDSVVFTGHIPSSQMPELLFNAKILALARPNNIQAQNGFPTKLGEYLATGNPVAVTDVGDIGLHIRDRENGFISAADNVEQFAETLSFIADNYEFAKIVGCKGRELVHTEFSPFVQVKKIVDYLSL